MGQEVGGQKAGRWRIGSWENRKFGDNGIISRETKRLETGKQRDCETASEKKEKTEQDLEAHANTESPWL